MMLGYEWGNPAAAAAAMLLFGEEGGGHAHGTCQEERGLFEHYGGGLGGEFFPPQQQLTAAALFSPGQRYGGMPPPPGPSRIGLNLGVRTYFSSGSPEEEMGRVVGRVCRRRTRTARCQAEGCGADLTHAKHYHRRHKVCEFHSKASIVIAAGLSQRFCQQCSRFHVLSEFDQGKRSCRKRLADHNRRRRKSQDLSTSSTAINSTNTTTTAVDNNGPNPEKLLFATSIGDGESNNNINNDGSTLAHSAFIGYNPETSSSVTHVSSSSQAIPAPVMGLGLCSGVGVVVGQEATGLSASSSSGTSPTSVSFLSHLGGFRWDEGEDGSSIRGIYQNNK